MRRGRGHEVSSRPQSRGCTRPALNNRTAAHWFRRVVWAAGAEQHPTVATAVGELANGFAVQALGSGESSELSEPGAIVVGTCADAHIQRLLQATSRSCSVAGEPEGFELILLQSPRRVAVIGGGSSGVLYGAFALLRHHQLGRPWGELNRVETPATSIRLLNHWSQWRGASHADLWTPPRMAGRGDSMFDWAALRAAARGNVTATKRITDWCRLIASVGINALAPQDVNYDERDNYLNHLPELAVMGKLVRSWGIRLFWTPNYQLAPIAADALFKAVPDFGGYLLKIGSEAQGGRPDPPTINRIARTLLRNGTDGQSDGKVLLRGFIYGSHRSYYTCGGKTECVNRMAIPAGYFGQFDGECMCHALLAAVAALLTPNVAPRQTRRTCTSWESTLRLTLRLQSPSTLWTGF